MARFTTPLVFLMLIVAISPSAYTAPIEFSRGGMDFVEVGDLGNASSTSGYGAVAYSFGMGKYEVTISQYCEFLNAVAQSDPYGLYDTRMGTNLNFAGISRSGSSGAYVYSVMDNAGYSGNRPISFVGAGKAMRFANWMSNGKGSGSTESGAYTLTSATRTLLPDRNPNAGFYVPTENEWFKSAYYDPAINNGGGGYHLYATASDTEPGNTVGSALNQANYLASGTAAVTQVSTYDPSQNYLTDVGAFTGSASVYGTFDQSGNVWDLVFDSTPGLPAIDAIILRGGSWLYWTTSADMTRNHLYKWGFDEDSPFPPDSPNYAGFRLAYIQPVPEPSSLVLAGLGVCGGILWHRRRCGSA
jgi:sulfatase modifying factor 1